VEFAGLDIADLGTARRPMEVRRDIQIVFQNPYASLNPLMTIGETIREPLQAFGTVERSEQDVRLAELLGQVGLDATFATRYPSELSGGERQRVAIARSLAPQPKIIVCDEPVSSLDVSMQAQIINLLQRLQEHHGLSYLFISHDLALVRHLSHRIAVMYHGLLVELGSGDQISLAPLHPFTQQLIHSQLPFDVQHEHLDPSSPRPGAPTDAEPARTGCPFAEGCPHVMAECRQRVPAAEPGVDGSVVRCFWVSTARGDQVLERPTSPVVS
jgi:oligopeptide/dipeptide ABC transporter ATP-binding protein